MMYSITEKNKLISFIRSYGYTVIDHQDGTFTVTDPLDDPDFGWRIIRAESALAETAEMIVYTKL